MGNHFWEIHVVNEEFGESVGKIFIFSGASGLVGLVSASISGGGVMSIMSSGTKAILMCWAEDPDRLHQQHGFEALHTELNNKAREWK